jgi:hypothetical protein
LHGEHRLLEGAPFNTGQEFRKFNASGQRISSIAAMASQWMKSTA